jgi:hypothetical protein
MSSLSEASRSEPRFNLLIPALPDAMFIYIDEERNYSVSLSPHSALTSGIRNPLVEAVGCSPRTWLLPPRDVEVFDTYQEVLTASPKSFSRSQIPNGERARSSCRENECLVYSSRRVDSEPP